MAAAASAPPAAGDITSRDAGISAESHEELFETYTEDGRPLGLELRRICHAKGIWHRAVYCFLFNSAGELLLQRRSVAKKVGPGQWDLSVAEHLAPGESFRQGVERGLQVRLAGGCARHGSLLLAVFRSL